MAPTAPLLSHPHPHHPHAPYLIITTITIVVIIIISFLLGFVLLSPTPTHPPQPTLPHPVVLLLSLDGFRFGYQHKLPPPSLPTLRRLVAVGTSADLGLIPVFPTLTFPNHYSIATGLYPAHHGIVSNRFLDPDTSQPFTARSHDPRWWLGEPLWETASSANLTAAVYFWPGGEVVRGSWSCPPSRCPRFDPSVPFEERVDAVLSYFDDDDVPSFVALYFEDPDSQGHRSGPDHPDVAAAVARVDRVLGRLVDGLERRGIFEEVNLILVGDHGMVDVCEEKYVFLEDLAPWVEIPAGWVQGQHQLLAIRPDSSVSAKEVVERMNAGLGSGKVRNGDRLRVYLKEDLPQRLHYSASDRVCPIIGLVEEGYTVEVGRGQGGTKCGGAHGYDNALFSMRSIFVGHGPRFARGRKVPSFVNVEVYNLVTDILRLKGAPNNGSDSFADYVLLRDA